MRQSKLFTKTTKDLPNDEVSFNAQTLIRAGFIDKLTAGVYSFLPLGHRVHEKIKNIVREEMNNIGGQEIFMPALTTRDVWEKTNRWDNFDALFKLLGADKKEYALGATHEEIVTPLVKKHVFSYKDLPVFAYQIQTKFRNELRARAGLIRGREFSMKDLYSFHADEDDLNDYYKLAQKAYFRVFERCGLLDITFLTFASGGAFSKYSHEFQTLSENGEDLIYVCEDCNIAINKEIIEEQKECPSCGNTKLVEKKSIEVGNIFKLGTRFSAPFGFQYTDEKGKKQDVIMGCYGIGPSRIMGTVVEVHHDKKGIVWPKEIAPYHVHLVSLNKNEKADDIYNTLKEGKIEVLYDDRKDKGAGEKLADADLIGCPIRIIVSEKTLAKNSVEIKRREKEENELVKIDEIVSWINSQ